MQKPLDESQILRTNPNVDARLLRQQERLDKELHRLGVDTRPKYRLLPPLGDTVQRFFHESVAGRRLKTP